MQVVTILLPGEVSRFGSQFGISVPVVRSDRLGPGVLWRSGVARALQSLDTSIQKGGKVLVTNSSIWVEGGKLTGEIQTRFGASGNGLLG